MALHLTDPNPSRAARDLDDRALSEACRWSVAVASAALREWLPREYADAHGVYRMNAPAVWVGWAAADRRNLDKIQRYADAFCREWYLRRGTYHRSTKGLSAIIGARKRWAPDVMPVSINRTPPPYTGPALYRGIHVYRSVYEANRIWLSARWDAAAKSGKCPVWSSREGSRIERRAPEWWDGLALEIV